MGGAHHDQGLVRRLRGDQRLLTNFDLTDVRMTHWIKENAEALGGDPTSMTLMGQSAGAILVGAIIASGDAEGLFQRAIMQSGSGSASFTPDQAARMTSAVGDNLGVQATAAALAEVADTTLIDTVATLSEISLETPADLHPLGGLIALGPVSLAQPVATLSRRKPHGAPDLLIGANANEAGLYLSDARLLDLTGPADTDEVNSSDQALRAYARRFSRTPDRLVASYRRAHPMLTGDQLRIAIGSDAMFRCATRAFAEASARRGSATYMYDFTWQTDALRGRLGASHLLELPFVFDNTSQPGLHGSNALLGSTPPPAHLSAAVHAAWIRFIAHGDPGWGRFSADDPLIHRIGDR